MPENPYQSPQESETNPRRIFSSRLWSRLPEVAILCWIITILLSMVLPPVQSTARRSELQHQQEERRVRVTGYVLVSAMSVSTVFTVIGIAALLQTRARIKLLSQQADQQAKSKELWFTFVVLLLFTSVALWIGMKIFYLIR